MPGLLPACTFALWLAAQGAATLPPISGSNGQDPGWWIEDVALRGACGGGGEGVAGLSVYLPKAYGSPARDGWPVVIALHGWNHAARDWRRTGLVALAEAHGVVVALPEMGRTVYESRFYPQTVNSWNRSPGACWIGEVVLPWLRQHLAISKERRRTAIVGYSTGGRGALVVAARYPDFSFVASLSGTHDLDALSVASGEYRIHEAVFGSRARFPVRWREEDVVGLAELHDAPAMTIWLAHGARDAVVPPEQLARLRTFLEGTPHRVHATIDPAGAHDFATWRRHLPAVFEAFGLASKQAPVDGSQVRQP